MHLLSNEQKAKLCMLARDVWESRADIREPLLEANLVKMSKTDIFNAWRHVEQGKAVGRQSLTKCTSEEDFLRIRAHFEDLMGQTAKAAKTRARHEQEPKLVAMHKLKAECARRGVDLEYAAKICRNQNKRELADASAKQLWRTLYTVKNRRKIARPVGAKPENPF